MILNETFNSTSFVIGFLPALFVGIIATLAVCFVIYKKKINSFDKMKEDAKIEAQKILKKADIDGRDLANQYKKEVENELKTKRQEIFDLQTALTQRETNIDNRDAALIKKETSLEDRAKYLNRQIEETERKEKVLIEKTESIIKELENVANLTQSQAKVEIMSRVESTMDKEIALYMKNREEEAEETATLKSKQILSLAMARHAQEITVEKTTSTISLPSDEMKGRIIGREGRNIKSLEGVLGVDILIDDTPETIVVYVLIQLEEKSQEEQSKNLLVTEEFNLVELKKSLKKLEAKFINQSWMQVMMQYSN